MGKAILIDATQLLRSPFFFRELLKALEREGLVGEKRNAVALFIVAVSRVLRRPLNVIVKGRSSSGKNWLVSRVLRLIPKSCMNEITSASATAWNYAENAFRHRVVYLQEQNELSGAVHPMRLLISEGRLIRKVTIRQGRGFVTETYVAKGPIASVSTTTKNRLKIDDETRSISLRVDESQRQTRKIVRSVVRRSTPPSRSELRVWRNVQRVLQKAAGVKIILPLWFEKIGDHVCVNDVSVRRYFPAFVQACRTVCLLRSFQRQRQLRNPPHLILDFADFATTALIFERIFAGSLHHDDGSAVTVRNIVKQVSRQKNGSPVNARQLAKELGISTDRAYRMLRQAVKAGTVQRVNKPDKSNHKMFLPTDSPRFLPEPRVLFDAIDTGQESIQFVHPLKGKWVTYRRHRE